MMLMMLGRRMKMESIKRMKGGEVGERRNQSRWEWRESYEIDDRGLLDDGLERGWWAF
jgi:hypothetical protein